MSSDSELEEFYDAEDFTPKQSFLNTLPEAQMFVKLEEEEAQLLKLKHLQEKRRQQEDEELQRRLEELEERREEELEKQLLVEMKVKEEELRHTKLDEMRKQMSLDNRIPNCSVLLPHIDVAIDELDYSNIEPSSVDISRYNVKPKYSEYSNNICSSHPYKEKSSKHIHEITCTVNVPNSEALVDEVLLGVCDDENEPDIVRSSKPKTPPNTLHLTTSSPITAFSVPVAPPRKKKKDRLQGSTYMGTDQASGVASSSPEAEPFSPGLPSELLTPICTVESLTKDLEHSLDLRSALGGRRLIKAEDADVNAVNSDMESPGNDSKSSLDSHSIAANIKANKKEILEEISPEFHSQSGSGGVLTDKEILESVYVLNLDTGEKVQLSDVQEKLAQGINPLNLHLLRRTKEFSSTGKLIDDIDGDDKSGSGKPVSLEKGARQKATKLKKFIGKRVGKTVNKVKSVADQVLYGDNSGIEEEVSVDGRKFKIKASQNNKAVHDFAQPQMLQELGGEHTGAVWTMKFSPCGRLLTTGGQDSVLRVWVLRSAFLYFDDIRHKYADLKVSPAPSHESLNTVCSEASTIESSIAGIFEEDANAPFMQRPFCKYRGHTADVLDVSWSKNYFILSSSMDKTVRLWHISRRECLCTFQHIDFVTAIVFHPRDDRYFLSGSLDGKVRLWNIPDKKVTLWNEVRGPSNLITTANFCHNGKFAVVGTYDGKCIFFSTEQLKYFTQIHVRSTRGKNAKGRKITGIEPLPGEDKVLVTSNDSRIRLYDLRDLTLTCKYKGCSNNSSQIRASFSPRGKYIVCGSEDHFVYVWKTQYDYHKFPSARRDRNDYWEAFKVHNAVVTAAIFAPCPSLFRLTDDTAVSSMDGPDHQGEIIVTADLTGIIKVVQNKPNIAT